MFGHKDVCNSVRRYTFSLKEDIAKKYMKGGNVQLHTAVLIS
jgi:hypothetical protein